MSRDLLINAGPGEVRAALIDDGRLIDLAIERAAGSGGVGELYLARVSRVLPGMNAAFLETGGGRDAFLSRADAEYADDLRVGPPRQAGGDRETPISEFVAEGEALIVQIARGAVGDKAPQATTKITLPGHRLVFTPGQGGTAVSRRIADEAERERLKDILADLDGGFIVRTAGAGASAETLADEAEHLRARWAELRAAADGLTAPAPLREQRNLVDAVLRDHAPDDVDRIVIDRPDAMAAAKAYAEKFGPTWADRLEAHAGDEALFDAFEVEAEIDAALEPTVGLPSGGSLVIQATQALTAIDVNTGGHVGRGHKGRAILETNLEAAAEIARQARLRNLGGLIAVDFVRMDEDDDKRQVVDALAAAMQPDPQPVRVGRMSPFGLVEVTRRRSRPSLADLLTIDCRRCDGSGRFRAPLGVALAALRDVLRAARTEPGAVQTLVAAPPIVDCLVGEAGAAREEAEAELGRAVPMRRQAGMTADRYELVVEEG